MNCTTYSKEGVGVAMMDEALALLRIIDAEQGNEDINESPQARETRLLLHTTARQLVAKMIEELRVGTRKDAQVSYYAEAA